MTTISKKVLLLTGLIGGCAILAVALAPIEIAPPKLKPSKTSQSKIVDTRQSDPNDSGNLPPPKSTNYEQGVYTGNNDASLGLIKSEAKRDHQISRCTLNAIQASTLDKKAKRELRGLVKAFDKKETERLVKLQSQVQSVLNTNEGRERYFRFYNFVADLYQQERHLFCDDDPFSMYLQFVEQVIEGRHSLTVEDIDSIVDDNIILFSKFSVLEYFIIIISVDIKFGEDIALALLQKLNASSKLQHQPLAQYSGVYWMLFHSFNISSNKSKEVVWRYKQLQFAAEQFKKIKKLPEGDRDRRHLLVYMIVAGYQTSPERYSVSQSFNKFINQARSTKEPSESVVELANVWIDAMQSINAEWFTDEQNNEILMQFVDYASHFKTSKSQAGREKILDRQVQEKLLWLLVESGPGNRQAAIILAIEILRKRSPDSERLSRYLLERADQLGQDEQFLEQIDRLIDLYPEDYALNTRRYNYQKNVESLALSDINQYLRFLNSRKGMEGEAMNEVLLKQELSLLQDRAVYYLNSRQLELAEVDRVQIYERSPNLESLSELGEVYNLNNKPDHFVTLFESQISLFGMHPNDLGNDFPELEYSDDFLGFLLTGYAVYADSLESVGDSQAALQVRQTILHINGKVD